MHIEEALTTYILSQTGITALIDRRFSFYEALQSEGYPYTVGLLVSNVPEHTHQGILEIESPIYQFSHYGETAASAWAVAQAFRDALSDYDGTLSGISIQYIELQSELAGANTSTGTTVFVVDQEFQIFYDRG